jgi:hypothetical protein
MTSNDQAGGAYEPGTVDEHQHGWAPDAPGSGEAKERAVEGHQKAFEAHDTQEGSRGEGGQDPSFPPEGVGESITRRGEDVIKEEGGEPGRHDLGTQGETERPVGTSTARASTGVDPQDVTDEDMPNLQSGSQGG